MAGLFMSQTRGLIEFIAYKSLQNQIHKAGIISSEQNLGFITIQLKTNMVHFI